MADTSNIRAHMEVVGSDGAHVGIVDHLDGDRLKLARAGSADDRHHYLPTSAVASVDDKVRLNTTGAAALSLAGATAAGVGGEAIATDSIVPPIHNRAVEGAPARRNFYLPWIVGIIGLILILLLLMRACAPRTEETAAIRPAATITPTANGPAPASTPPLPVAPVTLPGGATLNLPANTLNYEVQRFLASSDPAPRSFTFDKLNFDTGSAAIRPEDEATVDALAQILNAYPKARVNIVGYTDAEGTAPANAQLGQQRADAVVAALAKRGVPAGRMQAVSRGEANPVETNATAQGRFDNRRTGLVVTAK
jgi:outer membrane protein OmpA-like peptidoglycan-associated protein